MTSDYNNAKNAKPPDFIPEVLCKERKMVHGTSYGSEAGAPAWGRECAGTFPHRAGWGLTDAARFVHVANDTLRMRNLCELSFNNL